MNNPFRYQPHPLVQRAAQSVIAHIDADSELERLLAPGKMLGVLVVPTTDLPHKLQESLSGQGILHPLTEETAYLAAFSGNVGDRNLIEGFVPPIYDLLDPRGGFKAGEAEITAINLKVRDMTRANDFVQLHSQLEGLRQEMTAELERRKSGMARSKERRETLRAQLTEAGEAAEGLAALARESQFEKAELRRVKKDFNERIGAMEGELKEYEARIQALKKERAAKSDALQRWIFEQFQVRNAKGRTQSIWQIFQAKGLVPPGGTGECAAPKLLQYAYLNGLQPLYMGEFWYGASPEGSVRNHGHFYPSCSSKCGVLLPYMMEGLEMVDDRTGRGMDDSIGTGKDLPFAVIYEDEALLAIDKPGGMPAVPGLDGRRSALEYLQEIYPEIEVVHRLDMDTTGLLVFAKSAVVAVALRQQFERREVEKTYRALLVAADRPLPPERGVIDLPLAPDYEDRPRQKVDRQQGKPARTRYEIQAVRPDGRIEILFHPEDGRTHQLRVHAAHPAGLGRPIVGDMLYGGTASEEGKAQLPLQLRAIEITFTHPVDGKRLTLSL